MNPEPEEITPLPAAAAAPATAPRPQSISPAPAGKGWAVFWMCVFLAAITLGVFAQTVRHEFVNFDDTFNVYENEMVMRGLTPQGITAAFNYSHSDNWIPLSTLSHMLDCQWYGLDAGGHHRTNVILHVASVILLFLALRRMTGALWQAAFVAALFAIHPLHVESVAWVSERKDVLSGLFFMLTLWAYARAKLSTPHSSRFTKNWLVLVFLALGLMSKPMLVTLPFVLLLLDFWPLNRISFPHSPLSTLHSSLLQKLPLFGLVMASCVLTVLAQRGTHSIQTLGAFPISERIGNALVSYVAYIGQMFYPAGLAAFYPRPIKGYPLWEPISAFMLLAGITLGALITRRKRPYLLVGWLWYLGMVFPVCGVLQAGAQARADRFTYLPQIGLYIMVTWGMADLLSRWRNRRTVLGVAAVIIIGALTVCAYAQTGYWKNSETLWRHALACTSNNAPAEYNLGKDLIQRGQVDEALEHYQKTVEIDPTFAMAYNNLGTTLLKKGQVDDAIRQFRKAMEIDPNDVTACNNLGNGLLQNGQFDEGVAQLEKAITMQPDDPRAFYNLGNAFLNNKKMIEAAARYHKAMDVHPEFVLSHAAVQQNIGYTAWVLATSTDSSLRNSAKAIELAEQADRLSSNANPVVIGALAAGYAEAGRFPEAVATVQRALQQADIQNTGPDFTAALQKQLKAYQQGMPFRDEAQP